MKLANENVGNYQMIAGMGRVCGYYLQTKEICFSNHIISNLFEQNEPSFVHSKYISRPHRRFRYHQISISDKKLVKRFFHLSQTETSNPVEALLFFFLKLLFINFLSQSTSRFSFPEAFIYLFFFLPKLRSIFPRHVV